jgi:ribose 5-phosphate isomerase B
MAINRYRQGVFVVNMRSSWLTGLRKETEMRVGIATDHGGFDLKEELADYLRQSGHEVLDLGAHRLNPGDDYPDFVIPLAQAVAYGEVERGIAVCGSGVGASICANKIPGIRAGLVQDHYSAHQGVEHDDMNILCFGGRVVGPEVARDLIDAFLAAAFTKEERHVRRLRKVAALEAQPQYQ